MSVHKLNFRTQVFYGDSHGLIFFWPRSSFAYVCVQEFHAKVVLDPQGDSAKIGISNHLTVDGQNACKHTKPLVLKEKCVLSLTIKIRYKKWCCNSEAFQVGEDMYSLIYTKLFLFVTILQIFTLCEIIATGVFQTCALQCNTVQRYGSILVAQTNLPNQTFFSPVQTRPMGTKWMQKNVHMLVESSLVWKASCCK